MGVRKKADLPEAGISNSGGTAEQKFSIGRLKEDCLKLFGVTGSTFEGAAYGLEGEYSLEEMRGIIQKWQNTRIGSVKIKKEDM